jgi:hypothetical protein
LALISSSAVWLQSSSIGSKIGGSGGPKVVSEGVFLDFAVGRGFTEALDAFEGFLGAVGAFWVQRRDLKDLKIVQFRQNVF